MNFLKCKNNVLLASFLGQYTDFQNQNLFILILLSIMFQTQVKLSAERARSRHGSRRPMGLSKQAELLVCAAKILYLEHKLSVRQIAHKLGITKKLR